MKDQRLKECVEYFKSHQGFHRMLQGIREKYRSLGQLGGTVQLNRLTKVEMEELSGYFQKNFYKSSVKINTKDFVSALDNTRFHGVDFIEVLKLYFKEEIIPKKEEKDRYVMERALYFKEIIDSLHGKAKEWLINVIMNKRSAYRILMTQYDDSPKDLMSSLIDVAEAYNLLSFSTDQLIRQAVLATRVSKNPHRFDDKTLCGKLLLYAIADYFKANVPINAEDTNELLYQAGLIKDEVSNSTLTSGLIGYTKDGVHKGWQSFLQNQEPLQSTVLNLHSITRIDSPSKKIFVFENPTVFTEVYEATKGLGISLMCTFGNIKVASLIVLDKLTKEGVTIYYSGDIDPEGLLIADKLKSRYQHQLLLWGYHDELYHSAKSLENITQVRLNKLKQIQSEELKHISKELFTYKLAAYQEMLIDWYIKEINKSK